MKDCERNIDHSRDEFKPNCDFDGHADKKTISTEDIQTIIKFVQLNAPLQVIKACYNLTAEEIIKGLVDYISNSNIPDPFSSNNVVKREEEFSVKSSDCSDTVRCDLQKIDIPDNTTLEDETPRKMARSHFDKYTYPDVIIKRVCEALTNKASTRNIAGILCITRTTCYKYFTENNNVSDVLKSDILHQLRDNVSMLSICKQYRVSFSYIYSLLKEYSLIDTYNFEKYINHNSDKMLSMQLERRLGISDSDISRRYSIFGDTVIKKFDDTIKVSGSTDQNINNTGSENSAVNLSGEIDNVEVNSVLKCYLRNTTVGKPKLYFETFPFPDSIIIKICRKLSRLETKDSLSKILGISNSTLTNYFFDEYLSYSNEVRNAIVDEYKQHYSIFEIIKKYKLSCYGIYRTLIESGDFDCTKTMEHRIERTSRKLTVKEIIPIEYKLGEDIDIIAKRYGLARSTIEAIIHLAK